MTTMSRQEKPRPPSEEEIEQAAMDKRMKVPFVAQPGTGIVRRGMYFVARARSHTMAKRIANALNQYTPNEKGE